MIGWLDVDQKKMILDPIECLKDMGGLVYLGTPYTKYRDGLEEAFRDAARIAAYLLRRGLNVYSPIVHTHPIAEYGNISKTDHDFWLAYDETMMGKADALLVAKLPGWWESRGVREEITWFRRAKKPYYFWEVDLWTQRLLQRKPQYSCTETETGHMVQR